MTVTFKQGSAASIACIIALTCFIQLSLSQQTPPNQTLKYPISGLSAHLTPIKLADGPSGHTSWLLYSPGGPTYMVTVQADQFSLPITKVNVLLNVTTLFDPSNHQTWVLEFPQVSVTHPLYPGGSTSQNVTFIGGINASNVVILSGSLSNGQTFYFETVIKWQD
jgi:hypothetical protein